MQFSKQEDTSSEPFLVGRREHWFSRGPYVGYGHGFADVDLDVFDDEL